MMKRQFSIKDYLNMLLAHIKLIVILPFICAFLSYTYTIFLITPTYSTSMMIYVKNTDAASENDSDYENYVTSNGSGTRVNPYNMNASAAIAQTCSLLFSTNRFMTEVLADSELETENSYSPGTLKGAVTFSSVNDSQVMSVSITLTNPNDTVQILNAIFRQSEKYYKGYFPTGQIFMVEEPNKPSAPISPNLSKNIIYGFGAGLAVAVGIALLIGFIDTSIKSGDDLYKIYDIPVFAEIIDTST
ncbi:MAG: Wzz/FepE/Etk N-terminal domain-containing protein [Clostridia bacterium]|nr:Wzz/FepE/Etk N-terminal domain-containing protein [Clostridia bacterium]